MFKFSLQPISLLALLTLGFFLGGLAIDYAASDVGLKNFKELIDQGQQDHALKAFDFQKEKLSNLHKAAALAYDLAKISLGAVVALSIPTAQKNL